LDDSKFVGQLCVQKRIDWVCSQCAQTTYFSSTSAECLQEIEHRITIEPENRNHQICLCVLKMVLQSRVFIFTSTLRKSNDLLALSRTKFICDLIKISLSKWIGVIYVEEHISQLNLG